MKNIFSMDDPDYGKRGFFDPVFEWQTYLDLVFLIIYLPVSLVCSVITLGFILWGLVLLPFYIGIHIILLAFVLSGLFVRGQRKIFNLFLEEKIPQEKYPLKQEETVIRQFLLALKNRHNIRKLLLHVLNPLLSSISIILPLIFLALVAIMIHTPFTAILGPVSIPYFLRNGSFTEAVFVFFIGLILLSGLLHLIRFWSRLINKLFISVLSE